MYDIGFSNDGKPGVWKPGVLILLMASIVMLIVGQCTSCRDEPEKEEVVEEKEHIPTIEEAGLFTRSEDVELGSVTFWLEYDHVRATIKDIRLRASLDIDIPLENLDTDTLKFFQDYLLENVGLKEANGIERIVYYESDESLTIVFDYDGVTLDASIRIPIRNLNVNLVTVVFNNIRDVAIATYLAPREE